MIRLSASSLKKFYTCERKYYFDYAYTWPRSVWIWPLIFGNAVHDVMDCYHQTRAQSGAETAVETAVDKAIQISAEWPSWKLTNTYNALTLSRIPVWYDAELGGSEDLLEWLPWPQTREGLCPLPQAVQAAEGRLAIELPWEYEFEGVCLNGRFDGLVSIFGENLVLDWKTTASSLDFQVGNYEPDLQFLLYRWVANRMWPELNIRGVMLAGVQLGASFVRFERTILRQSKDELSEFEAGLREAVARRKDLAGRLEVEWRKNEATCFGCPHRSLCSADFAERAVFLAEKTLTFNPL